MPGQGKGDETAKGEAIPVLACKSGASITGTQPSLDFVGKMKTFHTSIDIPGTTAMDFHLVTAQKEVISKFHWLHNKDEHAKVGLWSPVSFDDAPDCTKRRTVLYSSQLNIPAWLQKILGRSIKEVRNEEQTTLNRANGNLTLTSRPLIMATGGDGPSSEYELACVFYQILNRRAADGSAYITVDVTVTAKAYQPWLWGLQSAVEAIFIAQAKDDILSFLEYNLRLFKELHRAMQLPSQQRLKASRNRSGTTPCGTPSRATTPRGAADRRTATQTPRNTVQAPRSAAQTPRTSKHVSSGPTITAAMQQQSDPTSAPVTAVQEHEGVAVRAQGSSAANEQNASHITPQGQANSQHKQDKDAHGKKPRPIRVYYDALEQTTEYCSLGQKSLTVMPESDDERFTPERSRPSMTQMTAVPMTHRPAQHPSHQHQSHREPRSMHSRSESTMEGWGTDEPIGQGDPMTRHTGKENSRHGASTPRYVKKETRSSRAPQIARTADGAPPSRVLYERPSGPHAVEREIPVPHSMVPPHLRSPATVPLRDLIPDPDGVVTKVQGGQDDIETTPDTSASTSEELQHAALGAEEQPQQYHRPSQPPPRAEREVHAHQEQGRYYIIMPAGAALTREPPRILEEVYVEGEDASGQRYLRLREVDPHMAKEHLSRQQLQRHITVVDQQMMTAQRPAGNAGAQKAQGEPPHFMPVRRVTFPEAPYTPVQDSPRQSGLLSSPEEEQFVATQQRRSKACGSQTARGDTMHALSESRRDMAKAKTSVQDNLRRVSAEVVHSEAQNYFADKRQPAGTRTKQKKKNWFLDLFKGGTSKSKK